MPLVLAVIFTLLGALWAALMRIGWRIPPPPVPIAGYHGALMISAFLGTLISLERALALQKQWAYFAPACSALGGLAFLIGLPPEIGRSLFALGSLGLVFVFGFIYRLRSSIDIIAMALGSGLWLVGNLVWLFGQPIAYAAPWWAGFLILTIAGERLELSRVLLLKPISRTIFKIAVGLFTIGLAISLLQFDLGLRISGLGLIVFGAWLVRYDVARYTIKKSGLTRYIATCLLPGYLWLIVGGSLWLLYGGTATNGFIFDALLHTIFVGFVMSMIFGHAPIIIPALMPVDVTYRSVFYLPLLLLQSTLIVRIFADLTSNQPLRMWAGLLNVIAILLFLGTMLLSVKRRPQTLAHDNKRTVAAEQ
jgi:hypothetical protein